MGVVPAWRAVTTAGEVGFRQERLGQALDVPLEASGASSSAGRATPLRCLAWACATLAWWSPLS